jgi:secreted trypsin-like serine protease
MGRRHDGTPFNDSVRARARRRRHLLLAVSLALASIPAQAIVNGAPPSAARYDEQFGWAVALEHPPSGGVCSAQLVSPTWVLTVAHCTGTGYRVRIGNVDRGRAADLDAVEAIRHPRFDAKTGEYDIGLIRLGARVTQAPVRLATAAEATRLLRHGARAVIAGWGKRSPSLPYSQQFIASDVELARLTVERERFAYFDPVSGPCGGDSGGPLLLERADGTWVLVGVASRVAGDLCAQGGGVALYVNVGAVRDFIEAHVTDLPR